MLWGWACLSLTAGSCEKGLVAGKACQTLSNSEPRSLRIVHLAAAMGRKCISAKDIWSTSKRGDKAA